MQSSGSFSLGKYSSTVSLHEVSVMFSKFMGVETDISFLEQETHRGTLVSKGITWIHSWIEEGGYHLHDK